MLEAEQLTVEGTPTSSTAAMPDYLLEPNAVLLDKCRWRQGHVRTLCTALRTIDVWYASTCVVLHCLTAEWTPVHRCQIIVRQMKTLRKVSIMLCKFVSCFAAVRA